MTDHCFPWSQIPETSSPHGVVKRTIAGAGVSLVTVHVPAGTAAGRHSHPFEQFVQVVSGSGRLETDQGIATFAAGSVFHFPPGTWHEAVFETETVLVESNLAG